MKCKVCNNEIPGRGTKFCSYKCSEDFHNNPKWFGEGKEKSPIIYKHYKNGFNSAINEIINILKQGHIKKDYELSYEHSLIKRLEGLKKQ